MFTALVSLLTGIRVRHDVGDDRRDHAPRPVLPVGGIKEKVLAAHRAGIKRVILPERSREGPRRRARAGAATSSSSSSSSQMDEVLEAALEENPIGRKPPATPPEADGREEGARSGRVRRRDRPVRGLDVTRGPGARGSRSSPARPVDASRRSPSSWPRRAGRLERSSFPGLECPTCWPRLEARGRLSRRRAHRRARSNEARADAEQPRRLRRGARRHRGRRAPASSSLDDLVVRTAPEPPVSGGRSQGASHRGRASPLARGTSRRARISSGRAAHRAPPNAAVRPEPTLGCHPRALAHHALQSGAAAASRSFGAVQ